VRKEKREAKVEAEELAENLSKKLSGLGLEGWEIYLHREQGIAIEARDQRLENFENQNTLALALRVIQNGRMGFAYSSDFRPESRARLLSEVLARAEESDLDPGLCLPREVEPAKELKEIFAPAFDQKSEKEKISRALVMEKAAFDYDPRIKRVRGCEYREQLSEVWVLNSAGLSRHAVSTHFSGSINTVAEQGKEAQIGGEFDWSFQYNMLALEMTGKSAAQKAVAKLGGKPVPSRKAVVIFASEVAGQLVELLSFALSGESLAKNKSWLKGLEGKKVFSQKVNLIDDGLFRSGPECFPFDDEGVASKRKVLVQDGVLKEFIFDSYYGKKMKAHSTANAHREQIALPPSVGPSNFYIAAGKKNKEEMVSAVDSGLLVEEVLGMHMADEITGEFSVGVSGRWISKGKIEYPVAAVAVSGNLKDLFSRVSEAGSDLKFYSNCASPSILIEEMEISGS